MGFTSAARPAGGRLSGAAGLLLVGGAVVGSAVGLLFSRLVADRLSDDAASNVRAVLGGLSAVGFLALGVQMAVIGLLGRAQDHRSAPDFEWSAQLIGASLVLAAATGAAAALAIDSSPLFRLQAGVQVGVAAGSILASCQPRAELLLRERWGRLAVLFIADPTIRLLMALWLISAAHPTLNLLPIVVGELLTTILAFALRPRHSAGTRSIPARHLVFGGVASAGLLAVIALSSIGLRSRLGLDAKVFNSSATGARVVGFLPLTISMIYFPRLARNPVRTRELRRAFLSATAWTAGIGSAAALAILLAPSAVFDLLQSSHAAASHEVAGILAVTWAINAVSLVALFVYIAHGSRFAMAAWPVAAVMAVGQVLATSAVQLAVVALCCSLLLAAGVFVPAFFRVQPILHARAASAPHAARPGDLTLVIPCFNPGAAVVETIIQASRVLAQLSPNPVIIAVSDGSTDGSPSMIEAIDLPMLVHVRHPTNRGKGAALRTGFAGARTEFVGFVDADGDLAPAQLEALLSAQQDFDADIVFGSKLHAASSVDASRLRRIYSSGYRRLTRLLFQLDIEDTQTGIKLYRRDVLDAVLPSLRESKFALDLEIFIAARAAGYENFVAVPVVLRRESGSTISATDVLRIFGDTMRLFWRAKITLSYMKSAQVSIDENLGSSGRANTNTT